MIPLIMKDMVSLKKTILLLIPILIFIGIYSIYNNAVFMIPFMCVILPLILISIAFGYDVKSDFEQFAFSMPIKRSSYVFSKMFFPFVFGIIGSISVFILVMTKFQVAIDSLILISTTTLILSILISAIQLPFILKYGAEKGRLIMIATYFVVFALSTMLKEKSSFFVKIMESLLENSLSLVFMGILSVGILIIGIALKLSIKIMEKKEY